MKTNKVREGKKIIRHMGYAALVRQIVNAAPNGQPPRLVSKFLRVGPCLASQYLVREYLKKHFSASVEFRVIGVRFDVTPLTVRSSKTEE